MGRITLHGIAIQLLRLHGRCSLRHNRMGKLPGISLTFTVSLLLSINFFTIIFRYRRDIFDIYKLTRIEFSIELFQVKVYQEVTALVVINLVNVFYLLLLLLHLLTLTAELPVVCSTGLYNSFDIFISINSFLLVTVRLNYLCLFFLFFPFFCMVSKRPL